MPSVMLFTFKAVVLCVVTLNDKLWTRAKEICRALKCQRQTPQVIRDHVSAENYAQKYQLVKLAEPKRLCELAQ